MKGSTSNDLKFEKGQLHKLVFIPIVIETDALHHRINSKLTACVQEVGFHLNKKDNEESYYEKDRLPSQALVVGFRWNPA